MSRPKRTGKDGSRTISLPSSSSVQVHPLATVPWVVSSELEVSMIELFHRLRGLPSGLNLRVIQFQGAARSVGTSRLMTSFASVVARHFRLVVGTVDLTKPEMNSIPVIDALSLALGSGQMMHSDGPIMDENRTALDLLLLDTCPIGLSRLSSAVTATVDGTVLVVEAERTTEDQIRKALDGIESCGGSCLGIVFNKSRSR